MNESEEISLTEAADLLKVSRTRIWQIIQEGRLSARKIGKQWVITRESVEAYDRQRKK